jgi:hypothetical protein
VESEMVIVGAIVDSWLELAPETLDGLRKDLVIVEAEPSLVPDRFWLEDLSENLCHGSRVRAIGRCSDNGFVAAARLQLAR